VTDDPCCDAARDTGHLIHERDCPAWRRHLQRLHDELEDYGRHGFLNDPLLREK
jgi:hypothetical protein